MEAKALKRMLKDFPFLWAINAYWTIDASIVVKYIDENLIKSLEENRRDEISWHYWLATEKNQGKITVLTCIKESRFYLTSAIRLRGNNAKYIIRVLRPSRRSYEIQIEILRPPKNKTMEDLFGIME